ncbi:MAG: hypothetical protein L0271_08560 [Gemmatimonadetes bacterium]|nr:hypothetical protein [Gemmatimonadota bacterium]
MAATVAVGATGASAQQSITIGNAAVDVSRLRSTSRSMSLGWALGPHGRSKSNRAPAL